MNRILALSIALLLSCFVYASEYVKDEIIIKFAQDTTAQDISSIESRYGLSKISKLEFIPRVYVFRIVGGNCSAPDLKEELNKLPEVEYAELNSIYDDLGFDDTFYPAQWYLKNGGGTYFNQETVEGLDIRFEEALEIYNPINSVVVSVVDSGVAVDHPELLSNIHFNTAELLPGVNGADEDGNGFIDDIVGWDYLDGDNIPLDENGHGTHVAGIIAAKGNNGDGLVGVCPDALILPVRISDRAGKSTTVDSFLALYYSYLQGARIINCSFGGGFYAQLMSDAIQSLEATNNVLIVCAAGNGGVDGIGDDNDVIPMFPASYDSDCIISVANLSLTGNLANSSNFGDSSVDIAAPGTRVLSTYVKRDTIWYEGFEGNAEGWKKSGPAYPYSWTIIEDVSGNHWISDSALGFDYLSNSTNSLFSPIINLTKVNSPELTFTMIHELDNLFSFLSWDYFEISATIDGLNYTPVSSYVGYSAPYPYGNTYTVDLSEYEGQTITLRFVLYSDTFFQGDGVYIDDIYISGVEYFSYTGSEYKILDGTSMAAPVVSGVAGLVWAQRPDLTAREVKRIILDSSRPLDSLSGKCSSGGMIDARAALEMAIAANYAPIAVDDVISTVFGAKVMTDILANDHDADGDTIHLGEIPQSSLGTFIVEDSILYFQSNQVGEEVISYRITDGEKESTGSISIVVSEQPTFVLSIVQVEGGTVSANPDLLSYPESSEVTVTADPDEGHEFVDWVGDYSGEPNPLVLTMSENRLVEAEFSPLLYDVTVQDSAFGMTTASRDLTDIPHGTQLSLLFTPERGYQLTGWAGDVESSENPLIMVVTDNLDIAPEAVELPKHTLSLTTGDGYTLSANPEMDFYLSGETVTISIQLEEGYELKGWNSPLTGEEHSVIYEFPEIENSEETIIVAIVEKISSSEWLWDDYDKYGEWYSGWLGWISKVPDHPDMIYHLNLGNIYFVGQTQESVWFYLYAANTGWIWAGKGLYPYMYSSSRGWVMHLEGSTWFSDLQTGEWFQVAP